MSKRNDDDQWEDAGTGNRIEFLQPVPGTTYHFRIQQAYQFPSTGEAEWKTWIIAVEPTGEQWLLPTHAAIQKAVGNNVGRDFRATYEGKQKMKDGPHKGKLAHVWEEVKRKKI